MKIQVLLTLLICPILTFANTAENQATIDFLKIKDQRSACLETKPSCQTEAPDTNELSIALAGMGDAYISVGSFSEEQGDRSGLEISSMLNTSKRYAGKISGVLFSGRNEDNLMDLFSGFSYTAYLHFNQKHINPNFGIGLFIGDTFHCDNEDQEEGINEEDKCQEEMIIAIYPEIGLAINLETLHIYPFIRRYNFNNHNTYGVNMGIRF
mgnify:CR=1 FL=1